MFWYLYSLLKKFNFIDFSLLTIGISGRQNIVKLPKNDTIENKRAFFVGLS